MATFIAKQVLYAGKLVQPGEEFEVELTEGLLPPPAEVATPKDAPDPKPKKA